MAKRPRKQAQINKAVTLHDVDRMDATKHGCDYLCKAFSNPAALVSDAMRHLDGVQFDTFVGRGLSGALVAPLLARAMSKHFAIVRKECTEGDHSNRLVEWYLGHSWVFIDDLISTGSTLRKTSEIHIGVSHA